MHNYMSKDTLQIEYFALEVNKNGFYRLLKTQKNPQFL